LTNKNIEIKQKKNTEEAHIYIPIHSIYVNKKDKYTHIKNNEKVTNDTKCHFKINVTFTHKTIQIKINKNYNETGVSAQARSAHGMHETNKYNESKKINKNKRMTNDIKCHFDINVIFMNKKMKTNINNNTEDRGACAQARSAHGPKNGKQIKLKNNKTVTNDTKCHYDINVTFINKNIKTKTNKNTKNKSECTQARSAHESKNREFIHLKGNNKTMTNDTKCHCAINVIVTHKNIKIQINLKNNNDIDEGAQAHNAYKMNKNKNTQIIKNKKITSNTKCHFDTNDTYININKKREKNQIDKNYKYLCSGIRAHGTQIITQIYNKYMLNNKIKTNDIK
jgi:hypothetical protein